jgi:hypothetical protein
MISELSCSEYLKYVQERLLDEERRANACYLEKTKDLVIKIFERELIINNSEAIIDKKGTGLCIML